MGKETRKPLLAVLCRTCGSDHCRAQAHETPAQVAEPIDSVDAELSRNVSKVVLCGCRGAC